MSRLGRKPIDLPEKVKVNINGQAVSAEGPAGKHSLTLHAEISAKIEEGKLTAAFPEYERYRKTTGMFFPRVWGFRPVIRDS